MSRSFSITPASLLLALTVGLGTTACGPGPEAARDASADTTAGVLLKPNGLPDTLENMLRDRTLAAFATLQPSGKDTSRFQLPGGGTCNGQLQDILVIAMKDVKALKHAKDFGSSNGYIVARLVNTGACPTTVVPIDAGRQVYWVARMDPKTKAFDSRVVNDSIDPLGPLGFNKCPVEHDSPTDLAEVRNPADVCLKMGTPAGAPRAILSLEDMSLWVSCSDGCCYTDRAGASVASRASGR